MRPLRVLLIEDSKELEAFSYSVSHDLRAPPRHIEGFSKMLLEDYTETLDDQGRRYLDRIQTGCQRMGQLIDDLLALSRVSRQPLRPACRPERARSQRHRRATGS